LQLEAVQRAMADGSWLTVAEREKRTKAKQPINLARTTLNRHVERIKRLFKWGCSKKIVPANNLVNINTVASLKKGRSTARETDDVVPVSPALVEQTLPLLQEAPADILRVLLLSGARLAASKSKAGACPPAPPSQNLTRAQSRKMPFLSARQGNCTGCHTPRCARPLKTERSGHTRRLKGAKPRCWYQGHRVGAC
jgi:hypothetical protein